MNDMAPKKQLVIGLGSGRCGTKSLAKLLNAQTGTHVSHEGIMPYLPWQHHLRPMIWGMFNLYLRNATRVGDVGFYWLNYVPWVINHVAPDVRFICLKRDRAGTVDSFMRMTSAHNRNHWSKDRRAQGDHVDPMADAAFPKFAGDKESALGQYWDEYYRIAENWAESRPDNFRVFPIDVLNNISEQKKLLSWAGLDCDWQLDTGGVHSNRFCKLAIVVGIRVRGDQPERLENAMHCLRALNDQTAPRQRYQIYLVEEDTKRQTPKKLRDLADVNIFIESDTSYSRGRVFNQGAAKAKLREDDILCLLDADMLVDRNFVRRCIARMGGPAQAALPYRWVKYLERIETPNAIEQRFGENVDIMNLDAFSGRRAESQGGALWIKSGLYKRVGGHDERFVGWGCEDSDLFHRLRAVAKVWSMPHVMLHMWHHDAEKGEIYTKNRRLYEQLHPDKIGARSIKGTAKGGLKSSREEWPEDADVLMEKVA